MSGLGAAQRPAQSDVHRVGPPVAAVDRDRLRVAQRVHRVAEPRPRQRQGAVGAGDRCHQLRSIIPIRTAVRLDAPQRRAGQQLIDDHLGTLTAACRRWRSSAARLMPLITETHHVRAQLRDVA